MSFQRKGFFLLKIACLLLLKLLRVTTRFGPTLNFYYKMNKAAPWGGFVVFRHPDELFLPTQLCVSGHSLLVNPSIEMNTFTKLRYMDNAPDVPIFSNVSSGTEPRIAR